MNMQCSIYTYVNRARLEDLKMFLEHEAWHLCPVKPNFSLLKVSVSRMMHTLIYEYLVYK